MPHLARLLTPFDISIHPLQTTQMILVISALALGRSVELGAETNLMNQLPPTPLFVNGSKSWQSFERRLKILSLYMLYPAYI